ncbi:MAG: hypothetical protein AAF755_13210 [Pseudomonadota bacterium]
MVLDAHNFFHLRAGRTHEACGASAVSFAMTLAGRMQGAVLWVQENWLTEQINPVGFSPYLDPSRLLLARCDSQIDVLATAEEALRSGAVVLTVLVLSKQIGLTAGRRLQLAAQTGEATGLCLIQEGMGSNAAETRWRCTPIFDPQDSTLQRWELIKNKSGTLKSWNVRWDAKTHRITVVSETGERPLASPAPDCGSVHFNGT